jgi:hypothetical protein
MMSEIQEVLLASCTAHEDCRDHPTLGRECAREVDLRGYVCKRGVRYLGKAKRDDLTGLYRCLAVVAGALCIVEVKITFEPVCEHRVLLNQGCPPNISNQRVCADCGKTFFPPTAEELAKGFEP